MAYETIKAKDCENVNCFNDDTNKFLHMPLIRHLTRHPISIKKTVIPCIPFQKKSILAQCQFPIMSKYPCLIKKMLAG